jgi:acid phosphatase
MEQRKVAQQMARASRETGANFVISTGDNFYPGGATSVADPQFQATFEKIYDDPALMIPWYVVLGNHDHRGDVEAEIHYTTGNSRWHLPSAYYTHTEALADGTTAEFFFIDSEAIRERYQSWVPHLVRDAQVKWLERELANSKAEWKIVVGHHPVYSSGMHGDTKALIRRIRPLFKKYGVQAYFNGHDHDLEHIIMSRTHYFTSGAGGETRPASPSERTQFIAGGKLGFLTARLMPDAMEVEFRDDQGTNLHHVRIERDLQLAHKGLPHLR